MRKQALALMVGTGLAIGAGSSAFAQNGFYGGVSMRDNGTESTGLVLVPKPAGQTLVWTRTFIGVS